MSTLFGVIPYGTLLFLAFADAVDQAGAAAKNIVSFLLKNANSCFVYVSPNSRIRFTIKKLYTLIPSFY